ncbi:MAG: hypothetical protein IT529_06190 [Burkholderiales bacterium]|nr:hypothetical protein [Burkholderiales bacterium]
MRYDRLGFEQAQVALAIGHGIRRPWMGERFVQLRRPDAAPPSGFAQEPYAFTPQDLMAHDWEIAG